MENETEMTPEEFKKKWLPFEESNQVEFHNDLAYILENSKKQEREESGYYFKVDGKEVFIIAENIADAIDVAESKCAEEYFLIIHQSMDVWYKQNKES